MTRLKFLFTLLLLGALSSASHAAPPINLDPWETIQEDTCPHQMTGTATYALSSALTGTTSSVIDLGLYGCFSFSVTSTVGAVELWVSNSNVTTTPAAKYGTAVPGSYSVPKVARYAFFRFPPSSPGIPSAGSVTPTPATASVWYFTPTNWPN